MGRHDPARHRTAKETAAVAKRVRAEGSRSGAPLVFRSLCAGSHRFFLQHVRTAVTWESVATERPTGESDARFFVPDARWPLFQYAVSGFAMTNPNKLTLLTPGFIVFTVKSEAHGIPGSGRRPNTCARTA